MPADAARPSQDRRRAWKASDAADAVFYMASLPLSANVLQMTPADVVHRMPTLTPALLNNRL